MLDELHPERVEGPEPHEPELPQPDLRPTAQAPPPEDDELAAYNRHLARLAEEGRR